MPRLGADRRDERRFSPRRVVEHASIARRTQFEFVGERVSFQSAGFAVGRRRRKPREEKTNDRLAEAKGEENQNESVALGSEIDQKFFQMNSLSDEDYFFVLLVIVEK